MFVLIGAIVIGLSTVAVGTTILNANAQQDQSTMGDTVTIQKTGVSSPDPLPGLSCNGLTKSIGLMVVFQVK